MNYEQCQPKDDSAWPIGMAYVPMQSFQNLYRVEEALSRGTVFRDLDMPFLGKDVGYYG